MSKAWQMWLKKRFQYHQPKTLSQRDVLVFIYRQGYLYLVLIFISFIAGVNYANNLILGFCFLVSAVLCISFYLTFKQLHGLKIELVAEEVGQVGQAAQLHCYFHQPIKQARYLYLECGEHVEKIYLSEIRQQMSLTFYSENRGLFEYPKIKLYSVYPFGLVRAWTYFYHQKKAWIAPKAELVSTDHKTTKNSQESDLDEYRELRNYQLGDSLHAVSWKQVARGQGMYIKVFEPHQDEQSLEICYEQMPSQSHEQKLQYMMGLVEQCEQQQAAYRLQLPQAELELGVGDQQLHKAKILLAQA
ncbi:DUF58 domain-containing protein [Acinetobacter sp. dk771]|uniref:DUF58 domain-containing protein n=1 Tax=Acinetobacter wanghuae TaxID=2662362 RepID=A0AA90W6Z6_9GAMM|nr:DUF58 domain-containing protein [Acinetobacter wanghuae]